MHSQAELTNMIKVPVPVYTAPRYGLKAKRTAEILFTGTVNGTGAPPNQLTFLSSKIPFPFIVRSIAIDFGSDHADRVWHYVLLSRNLTASTTTVPADTNAFSGLSTVSYAIGDNREKRFYPNTEWRELNGIVKVHIINNNTYAVRIKVTVAIEEIV